MLSSFSSQAHKLCSLSAFSFARCDKIIQLIKEDVKSIKEAGTYKNERIITSQQYREITSNGKKVLNFCANNYLGLANNKDIIKAAKQGLDKYGYGLSSVRFICGTQNIHKELEATITKFFGTDDTILYSSCFDANGGLFEATLGEQDAIISDALNHASIIDGIRMCKAKRYRYKHLDMTDLEEQLKAAEGSRVKMISTDGVFSMDGDIAPLDKIVNLAEKYNAIIMMDESHSTGHMGKNGKGTAEIFGVMKDIDIFTGTLGKTLGGASGGFTTGRREIVEILRQRSRPYLFSNSLAPEIVCGSLKVFDIIQNKPQFRVDLLRNTKMFRQKMTKAGFQLLGHPDCPIVPVYLKDAKLAGAMSNGLFQENIYAIGFSYPVVPKGEARIRVQLNAAHTVQDIDKTVNAFIKIGKQLKVIK